MTLVLWPGASRGPTNELQLKLNSNFHLQSKVKLALVLEHSVHVIASKHLDVLHAGHSCIACRGREGEGEGQRARARACARERNKQQAGAKRSINKWRLNPKPICGTPSASDEHANKWSRGSASSLESRSAFYRPFSSISPT